MLRLAPSAGRAIVTTVPDTLPPVTRLQLTRDQILAFRRRTSELDQRLPFGPDSLRQAAWAGLTDSMPRAAVLSLHARVEGTRPESWEDPALVQVWGPRFSAYVIAADDVAVFTMGRTPDGAKGRERAEDAATRLADHLGAETMTYREAGKALGVNPNYLRYGTTTGTILIRWEGAGSPTVRSIPPPDITVEEAQKELIRRYLHILGPGTAESFSEWAGVKPTSARTRFETMTDEMTPVDTPIGEAWILASDEDAFGATPPPPAPVRLLPSGDTYFLLWGDQRSLLVPDEARQNLLWTPRVWPGAVVVEGEVAGTWRRSGKKFTVEAWSPINKTIREAVEAEAASLPLTDLEDGVVIDWVD